MLSDLRFRLRALLRPAAAERDLEDELRFHREGYIAQLQNQGHSAQEAARIARLELGGAVQARESSKDAWGVSLVQGLAGDFRYAFRMMFRYKIFSAACVVTLALGIGAATAVFSVVDATLLRPLPYADAGRLMNLTVFLTPTWNGDPNTLYVPSQIELMRWRSARGFASMDAIEPRLMALTGRGEPAVVNGAAVTSGYFPTLGVAPADGRVFTAQEEKADARLAVISDSFRQQHFPAGQSALGQNLVLDGSAYEIAGVMPPGFRVLSTPSEVWIPLNPSMDLARAGQRIMNVVGRLRPGVTQEQARQELVAISRQIARDFPATHAHTTPLLMDLRQQIYGSKRAGLILLAGAVGLLLLLACVNVFNLMYGHLAVRRGEFAIRALIGGERWRLARLQFVETGVLALMGGLLGMVLMDWMLGALLALNARPGQAPIDASLDLRVAVFGFLVTLAVAIAGGVFPAFRAQESRAETAVQRVAAARSGGGFLDRRVRAGLVVAQIALAVTLLCASGVFLTSLRRLLETQPGFSPENVWSGQLRLSPLRYRDAGSRAQFVREVLNRIGALPGVIAAGTTQTTFLPNQSMQTLAWVEGRTTDAQNAESFHIRHVTPGYFGALRAPVIEGRAIDDRDQMGTMPVCMVNARLARQIWPRESAIGHRIRRNSAAAQWMTIVGVAGDVMDNGLGVQPDATLYVAYFQQNTATARVSLVVRTGNDSASFGREIERAVWSVDPGQPVDALARLTGVLAQSAGDHRFQTILLASFALAGLLLAMIGVYGVTASAVTARTWEMGVRLALGATPGGVMMLLLSESARRILLGVALGVALFLALGRFAASQLYQTTVGDPRILAAATLPLVLTALVICYSQARELGAVDPVRAMKGE
jgi:putative ABC transport system permease protein